MYYRNLRVEVAFDGSSAMIAGETKIDFSALMTAIVLPPKNVTAVTSLLRQLQVSWKAGIDNARRLYEEDTFLDGAVHVVAVPRDGRAT